MLFFGLVCVCVCVCRWHAESTAGKNKEKSRCSVELHVPCYIPPRPLSYRSNIHLRTPDLSQKTHDLHSINAQLRLLSLSPLSLSRALSPLPPFTLVTWGRDGKTKHCETKPQHFITIFLSFDKILHEQAHSPSTPPSNGGGGGGRGEPYVSR